MERERGIRFSPRSRRRGNQKEKKKQKTKVERAGHHSQCAVYIFWSHTGRVRHENPLTPQPRPLRSAPPNSPLFVFVLERRPKSDTDPARVSFELFCLPVCFSFFFLLFFWGGGVWGEDSLLIGPPCNGGIPVDETVLKPRPPAPLYSSHHPLSVGLSEIRKAICRQRTYRRWLLFIHTCWRFFPSRDNQWRGRWVRMLLFFFRFFLGREGFRFRPS